MIISYFLSWWDTFLAILSQLIKGMTTAAVPIIGAVLILLIGWFLAFFVGQLIKKILGENNIHWDKAFSAIGLSRVLEDRLGLSSDVGALLGWLVKWLFIIASFMAAVSVLELGNINIFLKELAGFLPSAVTAAIIVFLGFFFGRFIDQVIIRVIGAIGIKADIAGIAVRWIIIVFSILAAARYLNLHLELLWPKFIDFLVLAGAIAIGFGFSSRASEWFESIKGRWSS